MRFCCMHVQGGPIVSILFCGKHSHRIALNFHRDSRRLGFGCSGSNISRMRWSIWACEQSVGKLTSAAKRTIITERRKSLSSLSAVQLKLESRNFWLNLCMKNMPQPCISIAKQCLAVSRLYPHIASSLSRLSWTEGLHMLLARVTLFLFSLV